jgi:hypothetical protein
MPSQLQTPQNRLESEERRPGALLGALGLALTLLGPGLGCGGTKTAAQTSASPALSEDVAGVETAHEDAAAPAAESTGPLPIPNQCAKSVGTCTVDPAWVKRLCAEVYPDVALYLFRKDSPFAHGYLTRKTKAVNASGGVTSGDEWLAFDEEVVVLIERKAGSGGIQVSGAEGSYEGLRADGSCVTLDSTELTLNLPPKAKYASVQWRYLGEDVQDALKANTKIFEAYVARKRECKGAYSGEVSKKCVDLDAKLNSLIVESLKSGSVTLPEPKKRP